ncbi:MAG: hypothetical protein J6S71_01940 [Clostridia bacterium]|nr:hypothetical protein [Clostridia bacterium]
MSDIFIKIFNLAVTAGWFVLAVLLLRPLMRRAPKWINCLLWGIVGLRLALPIKFESIFSLVPSAEPLPQNIAMSPAPEIHSGISVMNDIVNPVISTSLAPQLGASVNPMQVLLEVAAYVWVIGIVLMLCYSAVSYILLRRKVRASVKSEDGVYFCDDVDSPFILGVIFPRIYIPSGMSGDALGHVLAHERAHLRRGDHVWKPIGFLLLSVYWFNPLFWLAYALLCRDIEAACDEKVIGMMDAEAKKDYSRTLLACSLHRKRIMACPLAFGEVGVKQRIKSVLNYKKPAFWVIIVALVATVILSVCFLTNPTSDVRDLLEPGSGWMYYSDNSYISVTVDNSVKMSGTSMIGGEFYDIRIDYRKDGGIYAEIFGQKTSSIKKYDEYVAGINDENEESETERLLLSGKLKAHGDNVVLQIKEDAIGLGQEKLVFEKTRDSGNRTVKIPSSGLYVNVLDCGSEKRGADVSFIQAKREGDDVIFTLKWKNSTFKTQIYGNSFEVYRYEGEGLTALDFIGYWNEVATGVGAFSMTYPSFNITEHFDISALGKYRLVAGDAWVDFEVSNLPASGTSFPEHLGLIRQSGLYAVIINYGSDIAGMDAEFVAIPYLDGKNNGFSIYWTNNTGESYVVDPKFEISRYNGKEFVPLKDKSSAQDEATVVAPNGKEKHIYSITEHYDLNEKGRYRFTSNGVWVDFELKTVKELYMGLDSSRGLDVYVWQMAQGSYDFALMPHSDELIDHLPFEIPGLRAAEMREILATYDIDEEDIYIIPYQNLVSNYIGDYWHNVETAQKNMYIEIIRDMILGDRVRSYYPNVIEHEIFDIDGDGNSEICEVGLGIDSKGFSIMIRACESGEPYEYQDYFYTEPMSAKFICSEDGVYRLGCKTEKGEIKVFDITIEDGHVKLTENKSALGYFDQAHSKISLSEADYSMINRIMVNFKTPGHKKWLQSSAEVEKFLNFIKQIEAKDPESVSGTYGTYYMINFCHDHDEIYSISIFPEGDEVYLVAGVRESFLNYSYAYKYKIANFTYEEIAEFLGKYVK